MTMSICVDTNQHRDKKLNDVTKVLIAIVVEKYPCTSERPGFKFSIGHKWS